MTKRNIKELKFYLHVIEQINLASVKRNLWYRCTPFGFNIVWILLQCAYDLLYICTVICVRMEKKHVGNFLNSMTVIFSSPFVIVVKTQRYS